MNEYEQINQPEDYPQGKRNNRSMARIVAFQVLYQNDLNPGSLDRFRDDYLQQELASHKPLIEFARMLINGAAEKQEEIDRSITETSQNWSLARMTPVDRNILRISVFEICFLGTPKAVVINEAVELAKNFGTNESAAFVNGILDKIDQSETEPQS